MAIRSLKQVLLAKTEVTYATYSSPTSAANAMLVSNVKINPLNATEIDRKVITPYFSNQGKVIADTHVTIDFDVEIAASGVLGTAPAWGMLMKGCALAETIVAATSVTYSPVSAAEQSLSLYLNIDGRLRIITGCRGNVKAKFSVKGSPLWSFSFIGLSRAAVDAAIPAAALGAFKQPLGVAPGVTTATLHGLAANIADFSFDVGNKMVYRPLINNESVQMTDRTTTGSITLEDVAVATKDFYTICKKATPGAFTLLHGITAGQKVQINGPVTQLHAMQLSEADNIEMLQMNMAFLSNAGNDEFSIVCL